MKKILFLLISFFTALTLVHAEELVKNAKSAILIEASTGKVVIEYNADEALAPASMTKIMTLLLTMEAIEKGNIALDDIVTVSENASSMGGSQVYLMANTEYRLEDMIKAVCIASGNDAAVVLAEAVGGSLGNFVDMMNKRAKELGLTSTHFVNVYGLDADGHLTSARDMAIMSRELIKHELILKYSSIYEEYLKKPDGTNIWMVNTNKLVRFYKGVDGLKTGYTSKAGYCLTATGVWNNMRIISVVMGEPSGDERTKDTTALLNYGKNTFKLNTIISKEESLGEIEIELGKKEKTKIGIMENATDLVKITDDKKDYTYELDVQKIKAPIKIGDKVGEVKIYENGKPIMTEDLTVKENVEKISFFSLMKRIIKVFVLGTK